MHTRNVGTHSLRHYFPTKGRFRFAAIIVIAATLCAAITALVFAQKPEIILPGDTQTVQSSHAAFPRRSVPTRRGLRANHVRASNQDQEPSARDRQGGKGQRAGGDGNFRESRLRRARPFTGDVRELPQVRPTKLERREIEAPEPHPTMFVPPGETVGSVSKGATVAAPQVGLNAPAPPPTNSFEGLDFATWGNGHPPDTNGDVGPNYYIQAINTSIGIFDKSNGHLVTAFGFNTFMSQGHFGNPCDTSNVGDPVVLYDTFEDRWIITDFAFTLTSGAVNNPPGAFQCFAVSQSGDPVSGGWNYYSINTAGGLGDYPKFGIWPDGIYMSVNMFDYAASGSFQNPRVYALNKSQMYAGSPTVQVVSFNAPAADFAILPS